MSLRPVAGMKIYIGGSPMSDQNADFVESDFAAVSWTEIDGWKQCGGIGDNAALITDQLINRGRDVKQKGTSNAGQMQNVFSQIVTDAGQIALIAAAAPANKNNYPIRIDLNDANGGAPGKRYFIALVMNAVEAGGAANTMRDLNSTFEINSNIVRVAAT
jgi:hypothetical protein